MTSLPAPRKEGGLSRPLALALSIFSPNFLWVSICTLGSVPTFAHLIKLEIPLQNGFKFWCWNRNLRKEHTCLWQFTFTYFLGNHRLSLNQPLVLCYPLVVDIGICRTSAQNFLTLSKSTSYIFWIHKALNHHPAKISIAHHLGKIATFPFLKSPLGLCVIR